MEGLAYLTFDADVKEELVEDEAALKALFQLSRVYVRAVRPVRARGLSQLASANGSQPQGGRVGRLSGHTGWRGHTGPQQQCRKG